MSFGGGIALSAKIPSNDNLVKNIRANNMAQKKATVDQDGKDYDQYLNGAYVELGKGKIHPIYNDYAKQAISEYVQKVNEEKQKGIGWKARIQKDKINFMNKAEQLHALSQQAYDKDANNFRYQQQGYNDPEFVQGAQLHRQGDVQGLQNLNDQTGFVNYGTTPDNNFPVVGFNPYKRINWAQETDKIASNPRNQMFTGWLNSNVGSTPKGDVVKIGVSAIPYTDADAKKYAAAGAPATSLESQLRAWVNENQRSAFSEVRSKLPSDYSSLDEDGKKEAITQAMLEHFKPLVSSTQKQVRFSATAPQRATASERNAASNFDVTVNYNADTKGNEVFAPSFKGAPEPKTFTVKTETVDEKGNKKVTNTDIVGVADKIEKSGDEMVLYVKDNKGVIYQTYPSASNLTAVRAQWGVSPFDVRNQANKKAGHENYQGVHPSTTGVVYGNIYKGRPQKAEGVTTPPNEKITTKETQAKGQSISPEDEAALNWANENPNDPRAQKIFDRLAKKGIQ